MSFPRLTHASAQLSKLVLISTALLSALALSGCFESESEKAARLAAEQRAAESKAQDERIAALAEQTGPESFLQASSRYDLVNFRPNLAYSFSPEDFGGIDQLSRAVAENFSGFYRFRQAQQLELKATKGSDSSALYQQLSQVANQGAKLVQEIAAIANQQADMEVVLADRDPNYQIKPATTDKNQFEFVNEPVASKVSFASAKTHRSKPEDYPAADHDNAVANHDNSVANSDNTVANRDNAAAKPIAEKTAHNLDNQPVQAKPANNTPANDGFQKPVLKVSETILPFLTGLEQHQQLSLVSSYAAAAISPLYDPQKSTLSDTQAQINFIQFLHRNQGQGVVGPLEIFNQQVGEDFAKLLDLDRRPGYEALFWAMALQEPGINKYGYLFYKGLNLGNYLDYLLLTSNKQMTPDEISYEIDKLVFLKDKFKVTEEELREQAAQGCLFFGNYAVIADKASFPQSAGMMQQIDQVCRELIAERKEKEQAEKQH